MEPHEISKPMLQLKKILVPVDFSESSLTAVSQAGIVARHFHSEIVLLHADNFSMFAPGSGPSGIGITSWEAVQPEEFEGQRMMLDKFGATELSGLLTRRILCSGDPAQSIVDYAGTERPDLIVMPTHSGAFRRFFLGSVTSNVLGRAVCPVWTGTHFTETGAKSEADIRQVTCAVDFGAETSKVVRWAADFAAETGAKLTVFHAVRDADPTLPEGGMYHVPVEAQIGAEACLQALLANADVRAEVRVICDGDIPGAVSALARANNTDLLVIGRSRFDGIATRDGNTYAIICSSPCPVVSI